MFVLSFPSHVCVCVFLFPPLTDTAPVQFGGSPGVGQKRKSFQPSFSASPPPPGDTGKSSAPTAAGKPNISSDARGHFLTAVTRAPAVDPDTGLLKGLLDILRGFETDNPAVSTSTAPPEKNGATFGYTVESIPQLLGLMPHLQEEEDRITFMQSLLDKLRDPKAMYR